MQVRVLSSDSWGGGGCFVLVLLFLSVSWFKFISITQFFWQAKMNVFGIHLKKHYLSWPKEQQKKQSWKISIMEMKQSTQKYEEEITPIKYI